MELSFAINGDFELDKCQFKLDQEFPDNYLYLDCLYKKKDNTRKVNLYFEKMLDAPLIIKIRDIVNSYGEIIKTNYEK